jgi:hypothetical protein
MRIKTLAYRGPAFAASIIVATVLATVVHAAEPHDGWWLCPGISLYRPCMCCCNDYRPKPMPCTPPFCCCGPDDYCAKPLPCTKPFWCTGCDDYCCKPMPITSPCYVPPGSTWGAPECCQPLCAEPTGDCHFSGTIQISDR